MTPSQAVQEYLREARKIYDNLYGWTSYGNIICLEIAKMLQLEAHRQKEEEK